MGIGKAAAVLLAQQGAKVGLLSRSADELEQVAAEIQRVQGQSLVLAADISQPAEMERSVQQLVDRWVRLDIVFANAGINGVWAPIEQLSPEEWNQTISINLSGTFYTIKYAVPYLKKQGGQSSSRHR